MVLPSRDRGMTSRESSRGFCRFRRAAVVLSVLERGQRGARSSWWKSVECLGRTAGLE
jgi:hypothetical protein